MFASNLHFKLSNLVLLIFICIVALYPFHSVYGWHYVPYCMLHHKCVSFFRGGKILHKKCKSVLDVKHTYLLSHMKTMNNSILLQWVPTPFIIHKVWIMNSWNRVEVCGCLCTHLLFLKKLTFFTLPRLWILFYVN